MGVISYYKLELNSLINKLMSTDKFYEQQELIKEIRLYRELLNNEEIIFTKMYYLHLS